MEPKKITQREAFHGGPKVSVVDVNGDTPESFNEDGTLSFIGDEAPSANDVDQAEKEAKKMTDEEIKIKSLKQAIDIAKLMSDITTDDVLNIAAKVATYVKG